MLRRVTMFGLYVRIQYVHRLLAFSWIISSEVIQIVSAWVKLFRSNMYRRPLIISKLGGLKERDHTYAKGFRGGVSIDTLD